MRLAWNPWGLFGLVPAVVCAAMGTFVFATRPDRAQNRRLGILLVLEGLITLGSPAGAALAASDATARLFFTTHFVGLCLFVPLIRRFLATIESPLTRLLATRAVAVLSWILAAAGLAVLIVRPRFFISDYREPWWGGRMLDTGPLAGVAYALSGLLSIYSLAVAISAYRRAVVGTAAKERARRYAIAFGIRDVLIALVTTIVPGIYAAAHGGDIRPIEFMFVWAISSAETVFVVLMAYGILRAQLFDIDVRLAAGVRRGTVTAIVLFAFFTVAEIAKSVVSQDFGYVIGAVATAALIVFVHKPVERLAAGLSSAMLPEANATPAYLAFRKLEVYLEAVEAAYEDGRLSEEDRIILKRLQAKLGVSSVDATRLEDDTARRLSESLSPNYLT